MKIWKSVLVVGIAAVLLGGILGCATGPKPIGNFTGTTSGTGEGFGGKIDVTLTLAAGIITDVVIAGPGETGAIGGYAMTRAVDMIKKSNSSNIDNISGATFTVLGIKEATQKAIDKIAGN
jgi:fumarate reductase flavoprotein subunit